MPMIRAFLPRASSLRHRSVRALRGLALRGGVCSGWAAGRCVRRPRQDARVIALHAVWSHDSRLCVWGEDASRPTRAPRRRGRPPSRSRARVHPFACATPDLLTGFEALEIAPPSGAAGERTLGLMLPSSKDGPDASPQLLRRESGGAGAPEGLDAWEVPAIAIAPAAAVDVLLGLPSGVSTRRRGRGFGALPCGGGEARSRARRARPTAARPGWASCTGASSTTTANSKTHSAWITSWPLLPRLATSRHAGSVAHAFLTLERRCPRLRAAA